MSVLPRALSLVSLIAASLYLTACDPADFEPEQAERIDDEFRSDPAPAPDTEAAETEGEGIVCGCVDGPVQHHAECEPHELFDEVQSWRVVESMCGGITDAHVCTTAIGCEIEQLTCMCDVDFVVALGGDEPGQYSWFCQPTGSSYELCSIVG